MLNQQKISKQLLLISDYFLYKSGNTLNNKKLQKLVYYAQAWYFTFNNKKLFEEKIEAWVHGPAIMSLFQEYKIFGFNFIDKKVDQNNINKINEDDNLKKFLDEVWNVYGKYDSAYLELLTHQEYPWIKARQGLDDVKISNNEISVESMREYYSKRLEEIKNANK